MQHKCFPCCSVLQTILICVTAQMCRKMLLDKSCWVAQLKKVLSGNTEATIFVESLQNDVDASGAISREQFEELCSSLGPRIVKTMEQVRTRMRWSST